jgi:hypothetical protein
MELVTMSTKKLLVAYDESKPSSGSGDFLVVVFEGATPVFFGLKSHRIYKFGKMVFLGKEIKMEDIFAKLVESRRKVDNVEQASKAITAYVHQLESFKIGNIVTIDPKNNDSGFELIKVAEMPATERKEIP